MHYQATMLAGKGDLPSFWDKNSYDYASLK